MAFILEANAVLRLLACDPEDPLFRWLDAERIRPLIDAATMGVALAEIRRDTSLPPGSRELLRRRHEALSHELAGEVGDSARPVAMDVRTAEILADLMLANIGSPVTPDEAADPPLLVNETSLIPAALAVQHNFEFVVDADDVTWPDVASQLPPEMGVLQLRAFERPNTTPP